MNLTKTALAALNTAFNVAFNERLTGVETTYNRIAMVVKSTTRTQAYPRLSEMGPMREWIGERYVERLETNGFVITNRKFEKTIAVSVDDIADDQVGLYTPIVQDMAQVAAELPDDLVWDQLERGFAHEHYDGQMFFDTDHPVVNELGREVSVSNFGGGTGPAGI